MPQRWIHRHLFLWSASHVTATGASASSGLGLQPPPTCWSAQCRRWCPASGGPADVSPKPPLSSQSAPYSRAGRAPPAPNPEPETQGGTEADWKETITNHEMSEMSDIELFHPGSYISWCISKDRTDCAVNYLLVLMTFSESEWSSCLWLGNAYDLIGSVINLQLWHITEQYIQYEIMQYTIWKQYMQYIHNVFCTL